MLKYATTMLVLAIVCAGCVDTPPPQRLPDEKNYQAGDRFPNAFIFKNHKSMKGMVCKIRDDNNDKNDYFYMIDIDPKTEVALSENGATYVCRDIQ